MNDFTKEELELLYRHMVLTVNWNTLLSEKDNAVMDKIESMIANYCIHKKEDILPLYSATGNLPYVYFCYKCGKPILKETDNE